MTSKSSFRSFAASDFDFSFKPSKGTGRQTNVDPNRKSIFNFENTTFISKPEATPIFQVSPSLSPAPSSVGEQANREQSRSPIFRTPISGPIENLTTSLASLQLPDPKKIKTPVNAASPSMTPSQQPRKVNIQVNSVNPPNTASLQLPVTNPVKTRVSPASPSPSGSFTDRIVSVSPSGDDESSSGYSEDSSDQDDSSGSGEERSGVQTNMPQLSSAERARAEHLRLLEHRPELDELNEIKATPIFTEPVRAYAHTMPSGGEKPFAQYGLLAGDISGTANHSGEPDNRIFWNISAPSSFFICGSQGSGKSHTLSCLLENALAPCNANVLPRPLTGIVFHYDTFISDTGGSPCEAAWLSSNRNIKVRVLCPPTNIRVMKKLYGRFPNITVEELRINESDLNTKRMLDLMAVTSGGMPLYLHVVNRILRDLRIQQQQNGGAFSYTNFKRMMALENLTDMQLAPLKQRLDTLESFMVEDQAKAYDLFAKKDTPCKKNKAKRNGTDWTPHNGFLTIVDLSCPCVTADMACSLFNICLSLFLEQPCDTVGRIIALDEAHKYMNDSAECQTLTEALLATIRLQRHLGARVVISTQEPTISPKLLDLCSVTIVHRFTSPDWLNALKKHLAGVSTGAKLIEKTRTKVEDGRYKYMDEVKEITTHGAGSLSLGEADPGLELFSKIVALRVGEALMFAPSAIVGYRTERRFVEDLVEKREVDIEKKHHIEPLGHKVMKVRIRNRTTADGGRSIMAS